MRNLLIFGLISIALSGCVEPLADVKPGTPYRLSSSNVAAIKRDVRASMKDPDSARFGAMAAAIDETGVVTVCGYVNGRNSFGGYVGEKPFFGVLASKSSAFVLGDIAATDTEYRSTLFVCRKHGVPI